MSAHALRQAELARVSLARREQPMADAERRGEVVVGIGFLAAAFGLAIGAGADLRGTPPTDALYVVAVAIASQVRFDVGAGFTVPTQALFVPMLFAVPVSVVPLLVALALVLGMLPGALRGRLSVSRLLSAPGNSWFSLGPAVVLLAFHDQRPDGPAGILLLALAAQFACDFSANAVRESLFGDITLRELLGEYGQIYAIDFALSCLGLALALAAFAVHSQLAVLLVVPLFGMLRLFSNERQVRLAQLVELNDAYLGTALVLGDVVEADDTYTGEHCKGVVRTAVEVAKQLGLDYDRRRNVELGALLHDVGKIAVPKEIINKTGKLDEQEWEIIKTHTIEGQKMLERVGGLMSEIGRIVRCSHECWDGSGYPDGLRGEAIPLESRIVSACDAFDAMTTTRSYRKAMPTSVAVAELEDNAGTQFDPEVVSALIGVVAPQTADRQAV
jgi:putative nucleotidyltransferase with HDIG domain